MEKESVLSVKGGWKGIPDGEYHEKGTDVRQQVWGAHGDGECG
jgi:hypothetical protein